jgi:hypothetical protein
MSGSGEATSAAAAGRLSDGEPKPALAAPPARFHATTSNAPTTTNSATTNQVSGVRIRLRMTPS